MRKLPLIDIVSIVTVLAISVATLPHRASVSVPVTTDTAPQNNRVDAPRYELMDLGVPQGDTFFAAAAVSSNCRYVVGHAGRRVERSLRWRPVLYSGGSFRALSGDNTPEETVIATGVNNKGTAVGVVVTRGNNQHAVAWESGQMRRLFSGDNDLSAALGIDSAGNIFGTRRSGTTFSAFIRTPNGELTYFKNKPGQSSICYGANDQKQFLVRVFDHQTERITALLWDKEDTHPLLALEEDQISLPLSINASGKIVGGCLDKENNIFATQWKEGNPIALRLPGRKQGLAISVNDQRDTVGVVLAEKQSPPIPFLKRKGAYYNLNSLSDNKADLRLALHIAENGSIVANGSVDAEPHTFLLQPK